MIVHAAHLGLLGGLLAVAVACDVAQRRVPNLVVAPLAMGGLAVQWVAGGPTAALWAGLAGLGVLALLLLPWASGKIGGGDLKLMAATAIWMGPSKLLAFLVLTAIAGAPVAVATRVTRLVEMRLGARRATAAGSEEPAIPLPRETIPFAAAIALGAFAALQWGLP